MVGGGDGVGGGGIEYLECVCDSDTAAVVDAAPMQVERRQPRVSHLQVWVSSSLYYYFTTTLLLLYYYAYMHSQPRVSHLQVWASSSFYYYFTTTLLLLIHARSAAC